VAVELRGREAEVERARLVLDIARVLRLEPADDLAELDVAFRTIKTISWWI
jgi:hypothetical protein